MKYCKGCKFQGKEHCNKHKELSGWRDSFDTTEACIYGEAKKQK